MSDEIIPSWSDAVPTVGQPGLSEEAEKIRVALWEAMDLANKAEFADAIAICRDLIEEHPDHSEPVFALSLIAFHGGDEGHALQMAERAHRMDPDIKEYLDFLAATATRVGRLADGAYFAKLSTAAEDHPYFGQVLPDYVNNLEHAMMNVAPSAHGVEGERLFNAAAYSAAFRELNAHIRLEPNDAAALETLARTALVLGKTNQAVGALHTLIRVDPYDRFAHALLARALVALGRIDEAGAVARTVIASDELDVEAYAMAMSALQSCPNVSADELRTLAGDFIERYAQDDDLDEAVEEAETAENAAPQIGFVSNAFYRSENADYVTGWFKVTPQRGETIHGYQFSVARDGVTTQIKNGCANWREVHSTDPYTLGFTLRGDGLDVLVDVSDLHGLTCAGVLSAAPAKCRVAVTGMPEPGLLPGVTHILSDKTLFEVDQSMCLPGQNVVAIPGTLFAREPLLSVPQDTPSPCIQQGFVTFGVIAELPALSADFAMAAGDILRAVPGSRLMVFVRDADNQTLQNRVREYFLHAGVGERINFVFDSLEDDDSAAMAIGRAQTRFPVEFWHGVDLLLDTFPLSNRAPIAEALWAGVPVVTLRGTRRAESVGASIVTAANRGDWVTSTREAYVELAVGLTGDPQTLAETREKLQQEVADTLLFDPMKTALAIRYALLELAVR